jgi:hypothetical protein
MELDASTTNLSAGRFIHEFRFLISFFVVWIKGQLSCCGVNNFTDFAGTPWMKNRTSGHLLPVSCCKLRGKLIDFQPEDQRCMTSPTDDNSYRMKVCYKIINNNYSIVSDLLLTIFVFFFVI